MLGATDLRDGDVADSPLTCTDHLVQDELRHLQHTQPDWEGEKQRGGEREREMERKREREREREREGERERGRDDRKTGRKGREGEK